MQSKEESNRGKWAWILIADILLLFTASSIFFPAIEGSGEFVGLSCIVGLFSLSALPIIFVSIIANRPIPTQNRQKPLRKIEDMLSDPDDLMERLDNGGSDEEIELPAPIQAS